MYSVDNRDRVVEIDDVPQSSAGAPLPIVLSDEHVTLLAYAANERTFPFDGRVLTEADIEMLLGELVLIEFRFCSSFMFGSPNDEAFAGHPLASRGLHPYGAFEIKDSSWIRQLEKMNSVHAAHRTERFQRLKHFVFAFHDSTFECVAETFVVTKHQGTLKDLLPEMERRLQW